jgi:hypothetical protein
MTPLSGRRDDQNVRRTPGHRYVHMTADSPLRYERQERQIVMEVTMETA